MKISRHNKSSNPRKVLLWVIIIAALAVLVWFVQDKIWNKSAVQTETPTTSKEKVMDSPTDSTPNTNLPQNSDTTTTEAVPTGDDISITIDSLGQSNGVVAAKATATQDGTCVFTFSTPNDKPVTRQVDTANKICSVSISQNEFSYLGQWQLVVTFYKDGKKSEAKQNVTIQ